MLKIRAEAFIVGLFNFIIFGEMIKLKLTMIKLISAGTGSTQLIAENTFQMLLHKHSPL